MKFIWNFLFFLYSLLHVLSYFVSLINLKWSRCQLFLCGNIHAARSSVSQWPNIYIDTNTRNRFQIIKWKYLNCEVVCFWSFRKSKLDALQWKIYLYLFELQLNHMRDGYEVKPYFRWITMDGYSFKYLFNIELIVDS